MNKQQQPSSSVIVGLGKTGLSCARFLTQQGQKVTVVDSHREPPALQRLQQMLPEVEVYLGALDQEQLCRAEQLVVSPGVSLQHPAISVAMSRGVPVVGDVELFAQHAKAPVIAITGSNGKSTVTTLLGDMARQAGRDVRVGGNIGTPVLELLSAQEPDLYVVELSSFQLETTRTLNAAAGVVLNLSQDHLDRYTGMAEYSQAKRQIYHGTGVMVLNADDQALNSWAEPGRKIARFSLAEPVEQSDFGLRQHNDCEWLVKGEILLQPISRLRMVGRHNIANALAALALGEAVGLPLASMLETLSSFRGLAHRCQWVAEADGVVWYNDSKATNVGATVAAIEGIDYPVVLIAGGQAKGQEFSALATTLSSKGRAVVLIGEDAPLINRVLQGRLPVSYAANMGEAVAQARVAARAGDAVMLSPACASFDMFGGFEERGEAFMAAVRRALV